MRHSEFDSVIFDLDGLLIDSEPIFRAAWQRACRECGFELSNDQHRQLTGRGRKGALEFVQSLSSAQLDLGRLSELLDKYERGFFNQNPPVLKPGAAEILKALPAAGKGIALATSTRRARAIEKLEVCKLATCFDVVVCGDEVSRGKPAPDIFLRAAELLQSQPERCIVCEDSPAGISGAKSAGMFAILVPDSYAPGAEVVAQADLVFESLLEVAEMIVDRA